MSLKLMLAAVLGGVVVAAGWLLIGDRRVLDDPTGAGDADLRREVAALRDRVAGLEERLAARPAIPPSPGAPVEARPFRRATPDPAAGNPSRSGANPTDPRWYLEQYVKSFEAGGGGSEFYRLAVDAHAAVLIDAILELILDRARPVPLRLGLVAMAGTPRFAGHAAVADTLVLALVPGDDDGLLQALLAAASVVGDGRTALALEGHAYRFEPGHVRDVLFSVLTNLAGAEANRALERLFVRAPDDLARVAILGLLRTDDLDAALRLYRGVPDLAKPVRLPGALQIGRFRSEGFTAFIGAWIARETDEEVLAALGASKERMSTVPGWHAERATGPPDTANIEADSQSAWASQEADRGAEWLELSYPHPMRAHQVRVHEVLAAGGVVGIVGIDAAGGRRTLWEGTDPLTRPGVCEISFPETPEPLAGIRVLLDTRRGRGWNEIDAVELIGPDGRAWAARATASSNYGEGRTSGLAAFDPSMSGGLPALVPTRRFKSR